MAVGQSSSSSASLGVESQAMVRTFSDEPDRTDEALASFAPIERCLYTAKHLGDSSNEFMECDCVEETRLDENGETVNSSCDENSDCINRLTLIECVDGLCESTCGKKCQNQRFQRRQYSDINIFLTENKGYGVRAQNNIEINDFIYEYIGEVIDEDNFRDRMIKYDENNFKHFYFMMLQTGQFIDATIKGSLARFCNHSCNPNAYVNKWVVNGKLKMGIFAKRTIAKGEEITFDYNVDRYGASAQKCYCGEPNCIGFLGGKTQTDAASLLPQSYADALGVSASLEKKWIKTKKAAGEKIIKNEEGDNINAEFVETLDIEPCDNIKDVTKVMSVLLQCDNKLIASKLFRRLWLTYTYEDENDEDIKLKEVLLHQVIKLHGYQCFKNILQLFNEDQNLLQDILEFLYQLPKTTKNGIIASHIDEQVRTLANEFPDLKEDSDKLINKWDSYDTYTRITKKDINELSSTNTMNKLMDLRRIRLTPGWEIIQENGRPIYYNKEQNRKLVDPPIVGTGSGDDNQYSRKPKPNKRSNSNREYQSSDKRAYHPRVSAEEFANKKMRIALEEQQALAKVKEEEMKRHKERFEQESQKRTILDEIISNANKTKELEREQSLKLEKEKKKERQEKRSNSHLNHLEHKWEKFFASFVPNLVRKYNTDIKLSHDHIKQCAKDIVKTLSQKELKRGSGHVPPEKLDKHKNEKVKSFVNQYMDKFVQKYKDKRQRKD